jgi:hypothetical protein
MYTTATTSFDPCDFHTRIYRGEIFKFTGIPAIAALIDFTRSFLEAAFHPYRPQDIHRHYSHAEQVERFASREKEFSQSTEVKRLWTAVFEAAGLDPSGTARDRLHLRFQPHQAENASLPRARTTATIAFHRDTWGSNLYAQTNWWAPVYPITSGRTFAMFPKLWDRPIRNTTANFDLRAVLQRSRSAGRNAVDADQAIPHLLEEIDGALAIPVVIEPGSMIAFSSAHAHAGVPNHTDVTRISLETRTVWIDDLRQGRGAPNVDGFAPWMSPGFFQRVSDSVALNEILGLNRIEPFRGPMPSLPRVAFEVENTGQVLP